MKVAKASGEPSNWGRFGVSMFIVRGALEQSREQAKAAKQMALTGIRWIDDVKFRVEKNLAW